MPKAVDRFMRSRYDARAVVLMILFISISRMTLEAASLPEITTWQCYAKLYFFVNWYLVLFFSFTVLLRLVAGLSFEKAANPATVGLLFGVAPPLIDYPLGQQPPQYTFFRSFEPFLTANYQPIGESIVLWSLILATIVFVHYLTRSVARAMVGGVGSYVILQLHGFAFVSLFTTSSLLSSDPETRRVILAEFNLLVAFLIYAVGRGRALLTSIARLNHCLPHFMLALGGAVWAGYGLGDGAVKGAIVVALFLVLLIHNDYYDQEEDRLAGRERLATLDDVVWSSFFLFGLIFPIVQVNVLIVLFCVICFLAGLLYHHPSVRLKERFCLSYKAEGLWAWLAFLIGASSQSGFPAQDLVGPSILVFGGGTLISIPKDWKDIEADRAARIPTYYVVFTRRGWDEHAVHRRIVVAVTLGLLVLPIGFIAWSGLSALGLALLVSSLAPGATLLWVQDRKAAVERMLWSLTGYLFLVALALRLRVP
jgi:hypothetical protein